MNKFISRLLLSSAAPLAFNSAGWKKDADGNLILDGNGNPIYIGTDGREASIESNTIARLNKEAKDHREAKEQAETSLAAFRGADGKLLDPAIAAKAIETVGKIDAKTLIDAGEVDKVRETIKAEYVGLIAERDKTIEGLNGNISGMKIDGVFSSSEFVRDNIAIPQDMFQAYFRNNFTEENGKIVAKDRNGNPVMSKKSVGDYADPQEALQLLVEMHPQKDAILRATPAGGSGSDGGGGARGQGRTMKRSEFEALPHTQRAETAAKLTTGEMTLTD